jgi:hypothetical protein
MKIRLALSPEPIQSMSKISSSEADYENSIKNPVKASIFRYLFSPTRAYSIIESSFELIFDVNAKKCVLSYE